MCLIFPFGLQSQDNNEKGYFSGGFQANANIFMRDSLIGAANIPQYDNELFGGEAWLDLNYAYSGFDVGLRFDMFNNSNLLNPNGSYSAEGIGRWHIAKKVQNLGIRVGYIYDQIGSGIIFRSYEERSQLIDNALVGARVTYDIGENWELKGFSGRQRRLFETYTGAVKGINLEGYASLSDSTNFTIAPGFGFVNRTFSESSMEKVVSILTAYTEVDRFKPTYNTYSASVYNTLSLGKISWYVEAAYKSDDIFFNSVALRTQADGLQTFGKYVRESGSTVYTSVSYAGGGLGLTIEGKRTQNFNFRVDPTLTQINGIVNFLPAMTRQNTYRLTTRYQPATQDISEQAIQMDAKYKINKRLNYSVNVSYIDDLDGNKLYRELYTDFLWKKRNSWQLTTGLQLQQYNQEIYEVKPQAPIVNTITPFVEYLYKINRKKSIRTELQYMLVGDDEKANAKQDYGDWAYALIEFAVAPHWSFTASDMYNINPGKNSPKDSSGEKLGLHYPRFDVYYTNNNNRYSVSYVKQVEGVVCSGGICRLEPAFSGVRFNMTSNF